MNCFLHSSKFTIYTDHRPLEHLLSLPMQNKKTQTWALSMSGYNCSILYLKSKDNVGADLLSYVIDANEDNVNSPEEIGDRNYLISAMNSNLIKPREFASYRNDDDLSVMPNRPTLQGIGIIREQETDKDIIALKNRLKNRLQKQNRKYM